MRRLTGSEPERGTPAANAPGHPPRTRSPGAPRGNRRVSSGIGGTTSAVRGDRAGTAELTVGRSPVSGFGSVKGASTGRFAVRPSPDDLPVSRRLIHGARC